MLLLGYLLACVFTVIDFWVAARVVDTKLVFVSHALREYTLTGPDSND
jgi:hypothetical protein